MTFSRWLAERDHRFEPPYVVNDQGTPRQPALLDLFPKRSRGVMNLSMARDMAAILVRYYHRNADERGADEAWRLAGRDAYAEFGVSKEEGMDEAFAAAFAPALKALCGGKFPEDPEPGDEAVMFKVSEAILAAAHGTT